MTMGNDLGVEWQTVTKGKRLKLRIYSKLSSVM